MHICGKTAEGILLRIWSAQSIGANYHATDEFTILELQRPRSHGADVVVGR